MPNETHPTILKMADRPAATAAPRLSALELRQLCLELGADDAGFVGIDRPEVAGERPHVLEALPGARTLVAFVVRTNPEALRSPPRSVANLEFHHQTDAANATAHRIAAALQARGARAIHPASGFPMEMGRYPGRLWVVSHKPVAVAAGLGRIGIHRNVIHPVFGNFVLLGTVLTDATVDQESRPLDWNPCLECKLCVSACPVGAIGADGRFDFGACATHNYREFMGGFSDLMEQVAEAGSAVALRQRVRDHEMVSQWQSLGFGPNYKAAYCLAVCPAGEDVIGPFLADRRGFLDRVLRPLQDRVEPLYVVPGSDAEAHAARRFPHKELRPVRRMLRPGTVDDFVASAHLLFQPGRADGADGVFHFTFTGASTRQATFTIRDRRLRVEDGLVGRADVQVVADAATWVAYLRGERRMLWAILRRRVRLRGRVSRLRAFERCFPRG